MMYESVEAGIRAKQRALAEEARIKDKAVRLIRIRDIAASLISSDISSLSIESLVNSRQPMTRRMLLASRQELVMRFKAHYPDAEPGEWLSPEVQAISILPLTLSESVPIWQLPDIGFFAVKEPGDPATDEEMKTLVLARRQERIDGGMSAAELEL